MADARTKLENIDLGEVLGVGAALAQAQLLGKTPYVALPPGWKTEDLSGYLDAPTRAKGNIALGDVKALVRYINKHKDTLGEGAAQDDLQTVILVDVINSKFKAVFDHHGSDRPGWAQHTATYGCPLSNEWQIWSANNGKSKAKDQEEFAFFIEQNILDVVEPNGAQMLQIVSTLKATKGVQFESGVRLNDGQVQLKYHETQTASAGGNGEFQIPEKIAIGIPVYVGAAAYKIEAHFRYRIQGSALVMWYDLVTPHKVLEDALAKVVKEVAQGTGIEPYAVTAL